MEKRNHTPGVSDNLTGGFTTGNKPSGIDARHEYFVTFHVDSRHYALPLDQVERVIRMAALIPVPEAPDWIRGLINIGGNVIPVIDLRKRFRLPEKRLLLDDRILVIRKENRFMGLIADDTGDVLSTADACLKPLQGSIKQSPAFTAMIQKHDDIYLVIALDWLEPPENDDSSKYACYDQVFSSPTT